MIGTGKKQNPVHFWDREALRSMLTEENNAPRSTAFLKCPSEISKSESIYWRIVSDLKWISLWNKMLNVLGKSVPKGFEK